MFPARIISRKGKTQAENGVPLKMTARVFIFMVIMVSVEMNAPTQSLLLHHPPPAPQCLVLTQAVSVSSHSHSKARDMFLALITFWVESGARLRSTAKVFI